MLKNIFDEENYQKSKDCGLHLFTHHGTYADDIKLAGYIDQGYRIIKFAGSVYCLDRDSDEDSLIPCAVMLLAKAKPESE
jgi:hypothetical protein